MFDGKIFSPEICSYYTIVTYGFSVPVVSQLIFRIIGNEAEFFKSSLV